MASKAKAAAKKTAAKKTAAKPQPTNGGGTYRAAAAYKSAKKLSASELPAEFTRADIEFIGVDHSGASYEARVYVNNPGADATTARTEANGYAGSYHIFGHGGCFGDLGHCDIHKKQDVFDPRPSHPLEPIKKVVIATKALQQAVAQGGEITITVVPIIRCWNEVTQEHEAMKFDHINVVVYG
jgi:tyrosinase